MGGKGLSTLCGKSTSKVSEHNKTNASLWLKLILSSVFRHFQEGCGRFALFSRPNWIHGRAQPCKRRLDVA